MNPLFAVDSSSTVQPVITMTRTFDAPREMVWEALSRPEHVAEWFGGEGFTNPVCEMDLRPGGTWRHVMRAPDGTEFTLNSVFLEVAEPERLAWKNAVDEQAAFTPPSVIQTVTLEEFGATTRWTLVVQFTSFADRDAGVKRGFAQMVGQGVQRMADLLTKL